MVVEGETGVGVGRWSGRRAIALRGAAVIAVALAMSPACTSAGRATTSTTSTPGAGSTTSVPEPLVEDLDELDVAFEAGGRLLDVEHGVADDAFYSEVDHAGVQHVLADGVTETIGESLWRGRLNAYVGYRQMAVSDDGTLYVADSTTRRVWKVEPQLQPDGRLLYGASTPEIVAGRGKDCYQSALELYPQTYGSYVTILGGACWEYRGWLLDNPDYGLSIEQGVADDGPVATEAILSPWNIDVNADETALAIAEVGAGQGPAVRVVDLQAGTISTEAAWVPGDSGGCDHPALAEGRPAVSEQDLWGTYRMPFCNVFDVAFTPSGGIVFAAGSYTSGTAAGGVLTTSGSPGAKTLHVLAGCTGASCSVAGSTEPLATSISDMPALDVRRDGAVLVADSDNHRIRKLTADGSLLVSLAGTGLRASSTRTCPTAADSSPTNPVTSDLDHPSEVSVAWDGSLLLAEDSCSAGRSYWIRSIH